MSRVAIPHVAWKPDPANANALIPASGASVTVRRRSDNGIATVYQAETGATTVANPLATDANGRVSGWVDRGAYSVTITGTGITMPVDQWDAAPSGDATIDSAWLATDSVTAAKIAADAVGTSEIAADAVGASEIAAGAVGTSELGTGVVNNAVIADGAVTSAKIADGTIQRADLGFGAVLVDASGSYGKIAAGSVAVPAGSSATVNTGLASGPAYAVVSIYGLGLVAYTDPNFDVPAAGQIRVYNPNGFAVTAHWLAIGN